MSRFQVHSIGAAKQITKRLKIHLHTFSSTGYLGKNQVLKSCCDFGLPLLHSARQTCPAAMMTYSPMLLGRFTSAWFQGSLWTSRTIPHVQDKAVEHLEKLQTLVSSLVGDTEGKPGEVGKYLEEELAVKDMATAAAKAGRKSAKKLQRRMKRCRLVSQRGGVDRPCSMPNLSNVS